MSDDDIPTVLEAFAETWAEKLLGEHISDDDDARTFVRNLLADLLAGSTSGHLSLAELQLLHLGLSVLGEENRVDVRLVDTWRALHARIGAQAVAAAGNVAAPHPTETGEPVPLTVAAALMLPEVRSGAKWLRYRYAPYVDLFLRVSSEDGALETCAVTVVEDYGADSCTWDRDPFKPEEFDAPCTLVDPTPTPGSTPVEGL